MVRKLLWQRPLVNPNIFFSFYFGHKTTEIRIAMIIPTLLWEREINFPLACQRLCYFVSVLQELEQYPT